MIKTLLQGRTLVSEIKSDTPQSRTWIELSLQDHLIPAYPLRTEPYSMIGHSPYADQCRIEETRFKARLNTFNAEDIEQALDPSYDRVGSFRALESIAELKVFLSKNSLVLEDFVDASDVDEYPL